MLGFGFQPLEIRLDMNRIAPAKKSTISPQPHIGSELFRERFTGVRTVPGVEPIASFASFAPIHYEKRYAYPLIVWLHGEQGNELELRQVMPLISLRNFVAIAPRGLVANARDGRDYDWGETSEAIEWAESRIAECVEVAQGRFNIHPRRVFLAGRGSGGTMALRVAWRSPKSFAGVAAMNGPIPKRFNPMRRVKELRELPCLLATSRDRAAYPPEDVCRDLRLLHIAGCTVALRQYPCADELTNSMLADLNQWAMELVCGNKV